MPRSSSYEIKKYWYSKKLFIDKYVSRCILDREYEIRSRDTVKIISESQKDRYSFARYVRALSYSRPRYETKAKRNPILHCHGRCRRKGTFTLHRRREKIALNGTTTRMGFLLARARRLIHRLAGFTLLTCT